MDDTPIVDSGGKYLGPEELQWLDRLIVQVGQDFIEQERKP